MSPPEQVQSLAGERCQWIARDDLLEHFRDDPDAPLSWRLLSDTEFATVKETKVRRVTRGSLPGLGEDLHCKWFRTVRLSDRARDAVTASRGAHEFRTLQRARELGLPAVEPLAAGRIEGPDGRSSFLVTVTADALPLPRNGWSEATAEACGRLLRRIHDLGLHARDLHPGNLLLGADGGLRIVDLTSALFADPLENDERATALAFFCHDLDGGVDDEAAAGLRRAYGGSERLWDLATRASRRLRARMLVSFGRRAQRDCRHTRVLVEADRWKLTLCDLHPQVWDCPDDDDLEARRLEIRAFLDQQPGDGTDDQRHVVRRGRRGGVFRHGQSFVKERDAGSAQSLLRAVYWLHFAGVPTPRPLGMATRSRRGFVFTERLDAPNLADWLRAAGSEGPDHGVTDQLALDLGRSCGRLHGFGLRCRDLKLENLVLDQQGDRLHIVDLDGVRRKDLDDPRGEGRDLGRLLAAMQVALPDRVERLQRIFWRAYLRQRRVFGGVHTVRIRRKTAERCREWHRDHSVAP